MNFIIKELNKKTVEFYAQTFRRMACLAVFLIVPPALLLPDQIPENSLAQNLAKIGLFLPVVKDFSERSSFPFPLLVSYGLSFWLAWGGGLFLYLISTVNHEIRTRNLNITGHMRRSSFIMFFILLEMAFDASTLGNPKTGIFAMMLRSRLILAFTSGGMFFLGFMTSYGFFVSSEYYLRKILCPR
ncbi:hypothetical protein [Paraburkholderia hayleyella]|uniref:hypothetical protein n=1 Tax=Paraburkholderia hayleyella TaxID=2152889 RepID=UPI00129137F2|nr:hypothetical protein [Paraburkholderia hayleyella]